MFTGDRCRQMAETPEGIIQIADPGELRAKQANTSALIDHFHHKKILFFPVRFIVSLSIPD